MRGAGSVPASSVRGHRAADAGEGFSLLAPPLEPLAHRCFTDSQCPRDRALFPALLFHFPGATAAGFPPVLFRWCSPTPSLPLFYFLSPRSAIASGRYYAAVAILSSFSAI